MVCSTCTLLHPLGATHCTRCGRPFQTRLERGVVLVVGELPTTIGVISGTSLLACLTIALLLPTISAQALSIGACLGIVSITNICLSVYSAESRDWLQGTRGLLYSVALMLSMVGELARLQGMNYLPVPTLQGVTAQVPVPSAFAMELLAALLIITDPLVLNPLFKWIQDGVQYSTPAD